MYYKSGHGILRMIFLQIQLLVFRFQQFFQQSQLIDLVVQIFSLIFSWFAMANLWLAFGVTLNLLPQHDIFIFGTATIVRNICQKYGWACSLLNRHTGSILH